MAREPSGDETKRHPNRFVGLGLIFGAAAGVLVGVFIGAATGETAFWIGIGIIFGPSFGLIIGVVLRQAARSKSRQP